MIREIKTEPIRYEEYWVLRGISDKNGVKKVVCEMEVVSMPTQEEIVTYMMIHNSEIDFVSCLNGVQDQLQREYHTPQIKEILSGEILYFVATTSISALTLRKMICIGYMTSSAMQ